MYNIFKVFLILQMAIFTSAVFAQRSDSITGSLKDSISGLPVHGATIRLLDSNTGTTSDEHGNFRLSLERIPSGQSTVTVIVEFLGYEPSQYTISRSQGSISVALRPQKELLDEVMVTSEAENKNVSSSQMSMNKMGIREMQKIPQLMGEVDVIRSIQLSPGVATVGEGATGFNVRGGSIDQNLILLDEAPVYNSSHLFGFFSVFNPEAVKEVRLMKGAIPAQYGGRLSSLLDVQMKEGNYKKFGVDGGIGTVSSRISVQTPIVRNKGSLLVAARRSYADLFLKLNPDLKDNQAYFYDISAKGTYNITVKDKLFVTGYKGRDVFKFGKDFYNNWGNATLSAKWSHLFNSKWSGSATGYYSLFDYALGVPEGSQGFEWKSFIKSGSLKADVVYTINEGNTVATGAGITQYQFDLGKVNPVGSNSIFIPLYLPDQKAREYSGYVSCNHTMTQRLSFDIGVRWAGYDVLGTDNIVKSYSEGEVGKQKVLSEEKYYKKGQSVKFYQNFEPRLAGKVSINENSSAKFSYNRNVQYVHLLSNTTAASPLDIWVSSSNNIQPQFADQFALGYFRNFNQNKFEFSAEVFYKYLQNQIDYINGAQLLLNKQVEADLLYGEGRAYGLELFLKKKQGKFTGWVSYTLSKSERQIEGINQGKYYNTKFDKPHNVTLVAMYDLSKKWSLSANFSYSSGVSTTLPDSRFEYQGIIAPYITSDARNNYRLPAYHRFDIGATYHFRSSGKFQQELVFSLYNVYGRKNPYSVYFRQQENSQKNTEAVRLAIIGIPVPSVTYNFHF